MNGAAKTGLYKVVTVDGGRPPGTRGLPVRVDDQRAARRRPRERRRRVVSDNEETCPACRGTGTGRSKYDACDNCDGSGHVTPCMNRGAGNPGCAGSLPAPEAEEHGEYCKSCRRWLDVPAAAE